MLYAKAKFSPYIVSVLIKCEQQWMHRYDHYVVLCAVGHDPGH